MGRDEGFVDIRVGANNPIDLDLVDENGPLNITGNKEVKMIIQHEEDETSFLTFSTLDVGPKISVLSVFPAQVRIVHALDDFQNHGNFVYYFIVVDSLDRESSIPKSQKHPLQVFRD